MILTIFGGFWTFSEKITFRCQNGVTGVTGHRRSKIATDTYRCYIYNIAKDFFANNNFIGPFMAILKWLTWCHFLRIIYWDMYVARGGFMQIRANFLSISTKK
jgi:hypothetical protein